ncbi:hypothetical protein B0H10DRAFT_945867 [Mycena sp. CBHHK59/15]|nr:hypothetical protein B0H10DRAFT_945867 [Mycena sp. CBHHK59/15]
MCAISAMCIISITEISLQIVSATMALKLLHSAVQDGSAEFSGHWESLQRMQEAVVTAGAILLVTNNLITDVLFQIYRCYVIWGPRYNKQVIVSPALLVLATSVMGYIAVYQYDVADPGSTEIDPRITFSLAIATNMILTGLSAGRIWWTRRHTHSIGQVKFMVRYNKAILLLLESGGAYCICVAAMLVSLSFTHPTSTGPWYTLAYMCFGASGQLVNIVPTLMIVRIGLGRSDDAGANGDADKSRRWQQEFSVFRAQKISGCSWLLVTMIGLPPHT